MDPTQANPESREADAGASAPADASGSGPHDAPGGGEPPVPAEPAGPEPLSPQRGLLAWVGFILAGSLVCVALGNPSLSILFALAGVFALAQASDAAAAFPAYRLWVSDHAPESSGAGRMFRVVVRALVPVAGAALFVGLGAYAWSSGEGLRDRFAAVWSFASAAVCLLLASRSIADRVTRVLFRVAVPSRTQRLTARLVVIGLLLPVPMQGLLPELLDSMRESPGTLATPDALFAQLLGEIAVALAGVGWLVRRRWPEVRERLGLQSMRLRHLWLVPAGLLGAIALNSGMEMLQRTYLHALWQRDQEVTRLLAGEMPVWSALVLGLSAGVGEEITVRGALQPRLGLVLTAVLFACGHVQYSWWGMLTIALLGLLLGGVRRLSNTTTAIVVHSLYDIFAVLTAGA